jgi:hypothetical protein
MLKIKHLVVFLMALLVGTSFTAPAFARKAILSGKTEGTSSVDISGTTLDKVQAAVEKVFVKDEGFALVDSNDSSYTFERAGSRLKDLSYGPVSEGVTERAVVVIKQKGSSSFTVGCDVYMVRNNDDDFFEDSTKVLPAFSKEYDRILRKVKREIVFD